MRSPFVSEEAVVTLNSLLMMRFQVGPFSGSIWAYLKERTIGAVGKKSRLGIAHKASYLGMKEEVPMGCSSPLVNQVWEDLTQPACKPSFTNT